MSFFPDRIRSVAIDDGGSILMETILVLPIFLMLLGGMFVIGDLLMGRLAAQEMDRALAWRAMDRFGPTGFDQGSFSHLTGPHGIAEKPAPNLYSFSIEGSGKSRGNRWVEENAGRADVQVNVPWWTALIDVQDVLMGDPGSPDRFQSEFKLNSEDDKFLQNARVFVFRRRPESNGGMREVEAGLLSWPDIALDNMAGLAVKKQSGAFSEYRVENYKRNALAIAVSGDPGP